MIRRDSTAEIGEDGKRGCGGVGGVGGVGGGRNPANGFTESNRAPARRLTGQTDRKWSATAYKESMITK